MITVTLIVGKLSNRPMAPIRFAQYQSGFTYILVLMALLVVGILAEVAYIPNYQKVKRDKEQELLFRGMAYQKAIQSYYEMNKSRKQYPRRLEDLLQDNRVAHARHIRQLYTDPFATGEKTAVGDAEWVLVRNKSGGITGIASSSSGEPLKQMNFPSGYELLEGAEHYSDWLFEYRPAARTSLNKPSAGL